MGSCTLGTLYTSNLGPIPPKSDCTISAFCPWITRITSEDFGPLTQQIVPCVLGRRNADSHHLSLHNRGILYFYFLNTWTISCRNTGISIQPVCVCVLIVCVSGWAAFSGVLVRSLVDWSPFWHSIMGHTQFQFPLHLLWTGKTMGGKTNPWVECTQGSKWGVEWLGMLIFKWTPPCLALLFFAGFIIVWTSSRSVQFTLLYNCIIERKKNKNKNNVYTKKNTVYMRRRKVQNTVYKKKEMRTAMYKILCIRRRRWGPQCTKYYV